MLLSFPPCSFVVTSRRLIVDDITYFTGRRLADEDVGGVPVSLSALCRVPTSLVARTVALELRCTYMAPAFLYETIPSEKLKFDMQREKEVE